MAVLKAAVLASLASTAVAKSVPANLQNLLNSIVSQGSCNNQLASGFYSEDNDGGTTSYCGDHLADYGIVYLQSINGKLANMDIDCDGIQGGPADDGRCGDSSDTQSITAFADTVASYGTGQQDLDANAHPYVVFGNDGSKPNWRTFDPQSVGVEPLSVMAVVCNNQLVYGVWGDTNGDDGDFPVVGEASIALATACFGDSVNGDSGHDADDVLYIAFTGPSAVPGAGGAQWNAQDYNDFENSISALGDSLVARIGTSSSGGGGSTGGGGGSSGGSGSGGSTSCSWEGHCAGASCGSDDDCSDDLTCSNGVCSGGSSSGGGGSSSGGSGGSSSSCSWEGHCFGAPCSSDDDCSDPWECVNGSCGN
ncbi:fungal chitosanase of glycosyl hydrolase group 75 domain-containing protein [Trichoderma evansii]